MRGSGGLRVDAKLPYVEVIVSETEIFEAPGLVGKFDTVDFLVGMIISRGGIFCGLMIGRMGPFFEIFSVYYPYAHDFRKRI